MKRAAATAKDELAIVQEFVEDELACRLRSHMPGGSPYIAQAKEALKSVRRARRQLLCFERDQLDALLWAIELAISDQKHYITVGDVIADYGKEWPVVSKAKADSLYSLSRFCKLHAPGLVQECRDLARLMRKT